MANRAILIPEQSLTADNISQTSEDPTSGLVTTPAVRGTANEGRLDPNPVDNPDSGYDIDVWERVAGNVGSARAGYKDSTNNDYRAKAATHIPHHVQWLEYGTTSAEQFIRPKALSMQSGELLVTYVTGAGELRWFTIGTDGTINATHTNEATSFDASDVIMADVVQMPDGELIMFVFGTDGPNGEMALVRKTSKGDTDATIEWNFGPSNLNTEISVGGAVPAIIPTGFAVEVLPSGRLAILFHRSGFTDGPGSTDVLRTFSDDRGVSWAELTNPINYQEVGYGLNLTPYLGGVDLTRDPETGSLVGIVGVAAAYTSGMAVVGDNKDVPTNEPSVMCLVSDDGDSWSSVIKKNARTAIGGAYFTGPYWDNPLYPEGMLEGAVVYGDDGLLKIFGSFHGDSNNSDVPGYFDDLVMFSSTKSGISAKDGGPELPSGTPDTGASPLVCSDMFEAPVPSAVGFRTPFIQDVTMRRFAVGSTGTPSGDLDGGSAVYAGPRFVEAVNHAGAIYLLMACEDTTNTQYALGFMMLNVWTELWEKGGLVTNNSTALLGFPYASTAGWFACVTPTQAGITVVNGGAQSLDETTRGLQVAPAAAASTFGSSFAAAGFRPNPILIRFQMKATSGGSLTQDDIAMRILASDGTNQLDISIRFEVGSSSIRVYDNHAAATVGTDVIDFTTLGVEVVVSIADDLDINGIFYRAMTTDPEDAVTVRATGSAAYTPTTVVAVTETWTAGTHTATSPDSTWMGVWLSRAAAASTTAEGAVLWDGIFAWDASPPQIPEYRVDESQYDDGLRHGARAQVVRSFGQYYRNGMRLSWRGAAGREGNSWDVASGNRFERENIVRTPVTRYWRSGDDSGTVTIQWDAGNGARFNPEAVAMFGVNAAKFDFQMDTSSAFGAPPINFAIDVSGGNVARHHTQFSGYTIGGADNREIAITGVSAQPMTPHQFRSSDRVVWYMWNAGLSKSIRIVDNDGYRLILAASAVGATGENYIYPDKIGFNVSGGNLGTGGGYRYMRLKFDAQDLYEGYYKVGLINVGQLLDLTVGMHPEWGWTRTDAVPVSEAAIVTGGKRVTNVYDGALQTWSFGWSGLKDFPARGSLATWQGIRDDFTKLLYALQRVEGGEVPVALFPEYEDGRATFVARSFDVIPCLMTGPFSGGHVAYENCRDSDVEGSVRAILNLAPFTFTEIT